MYNNATECAGKAKCCGPLSRDPTDLTEGFICDDVASEDKSEYTFLYWLIS